MPTHDYTTILEDLQGNQIAEVTNAEQTKLALTLSRTDTYSFVIPNSHRLAHYFFDPTWDGMVRVYRDGVLQHHGVVVSSDDQEDTKKGINSITVTSASPWWRMGFRLLGNTAYGYAYGDASTTYNFTAIAQRILSDANAAGYTGIQWDATSLNSANSGAVGLWYFKPASDAIQELGAAFNGYDFRVLPTEAINVGQAFPQIGKLYVSPSIGAVKAGVVFEYGTAKANLVKYGHTLDRTTLGNQGYIQQPAAADHTGILNYTDAASVSARGVYQILVDDGGVTWDLLRAALVQETVQARTQARRVLTVQPANNASPVPLVDYTLGDTISASIAVNNTNLMLATFRVYSITLTSDQEGNESVSLGLVQA